MSDQNAFETIFHSLSSPNGVAIVNFSLNALAIILGAIIASKLGHVLIRLGIRRLVRANHFNNLSESDVTKRRDTLLSICNAVWTVLVTLVAGYGLVKLFVPNLDPAPLFASAGIIGIALGFGAQSLVKDFLSGLFILLENQYRVGDVVDIEGAAGTVEKVTVRSTVIRDIDGNVHYIANGNIMHVINKTMDFSKVHLTIAVRPDTNIDKLSELINAVGEDLTKHKDWAPKILEAPHFINVGNFTDISMEVIISGKTLPAEQWGVTGELRKRLLKAFTKNSIHLAQLPITGLPMMNAQKRR